MCFTLGARTAELAPEGSTRLLHGVRPAVQRDRRAGGRRRGRRHQAGEQTKDFLPTFPCPIPTPLPHLSLPSNNPSSPIPTPSPQYQLFLLTFPPPSPYQPLLVTFPSPIPTLLTFPSPNTNPSSPIPTHPPPHKSLLPHTNPSSPRLSICISPIFPMSPYQIQPPPPLPNTENFMPPYTHFNNKCSTCFLISLVFLEKSLLLCLPLPIACVNARIFHRSVWEDCFLICLVFQEKLIFYFFRFLGKFLLLCLPIACMNARIFHQSVQEDCFLICLVFQEKFVIFNFSCFLGKLLARRRGCVNRRRNDEEGAGSTGSDLGASLHRSVVLRKATSFAQGNCLQSDHPCQL